MLQKYNRYVLLKLFLDSPTENFRLRELSRLSGISPPSVMNYLKEFENQELLERINKRGIPFYHAIRDNPRFVIYKKISIIYEIYESGLIDDLWDKLSPEAIILYGSHARGEAIEGSDVDLFIIGKESRIDLTEFESKLKKSLHLMFEQDVNSIPNELKNNLVNGVILKGYFKVF